MDWECEWRHSRKRWAGILGYFEKSSELRFEPRRVQFGLGVRRALSGQMEQST